MHFEYKGHHIAIIDGLGFDRYCCRIRIDDGRTADFYVGEGEPVTIAKQWIDAREGE